MLCHFRTRSLKAKLRSVEPIESRFLGGATNQSSGGSSTQRNWLEQTQTSDHFPTFSKVKNDDELQRFESVWKLRRRLETLKAKDAKDLAWDNHGKLESPFKHRHGGAKKPVMANQPPRA